MLFFQPMRMGEGHVQFNSVHGVHFPSNNHGPGQVKDMI